MERQNRENQQAAEQAAAARSQEAARQLEFERQQADEVAKALTKANPETALLTAQAVAEAPSNDIARPAYNEAVIDPVHNQVVAQAAAPREAERRASTQERLNAMALLSALDGQFAQTGDAIQRAGSEIQTLGGYRQGSLNANAAETAFRPATVTTLPSTSVGLDPSRVSKKPLPSVLELDYVTRSLNDTAKAGDGRGALGGNTNQGRIYGKLAARLRGAMKEAVPENRTALDYASTEIAMKEARDFGGTILRPSVSRDQVAEALKEAPFSERQAVKAALRTALDDTLANTRAVMSRAAQGTEAGEAIKAVRDLSSRAARDKLALVLGPQEARQLTDALDQAATAFEISAAMSQNSKTAVRQAVQGSVSESAAMGPLAGSRPGSRSRRRSGSPRSSRGQARRRWRRARPASWRRSPPP